MYQSMGTCTPPKSNQSPKIINKSSKYTTFLVNAEVVIDVNLSDQALSDSNNYNELNV